jgi:UDP-N-acetylglucosamine 2-epimerase (non-hydrolysing)
MQIMLAIGARPGYMKTWPVYKAFEARGIRPTVVATGQHHDILRQQQEILYMPIDHWLLKEQPSLHLSQLYGAIYDEAVKYLALVEPDAVFVNGDTTSALAVAMAAFHLQIPVAHIESGLRSGRLDSPYPEEWNRIAIDGMSTYLFAPTRRAAGICQTLNPHGKISITGNTVIDALKEGMRLADERLVKGYSHGPYILLDLHRRETDERGMEEIVKVVIRQAAAHGIRVVWPAHPNPKVQRIARQYDGSYLWVEPPLNYLTFIQFMRGAELILTDSGGVVEEAITIGTPTLQLRDHTDRQEAVDYQYSWLATTNPDEIERLLKIAIPWAPRWKEWMTAYATKNPYGDGTAGDKSVAFFLGEFNDAK